MLDWNKVMRYVRGRLALPSTFIEKTESEIREWIIDNSLATYSNYYPDWERVGIVTASSTYINPLKRNQYIIHDEEGLEIYGVRECYFPFEGQAFSGHPIMPPMSFGNLLPWSTDVFKSRFFHPFSMFSYTYRFIHPNFIEIFTDKKPAHFVVEYERIHPPDLRKIPASTERIFKDLCLADIMIWVGGMRTMYTDLATPFGPIPLKGEELLSRGEELRRELIDKMEEDSRPPVTIECY